MKLSKFLFFIPIGKQHHIVYNTLNMSISILDNDLIDAIKRKDFKNIPKSFLERLKKLRIIIEDDEDELAIYRYIFEKAKYSTRNVGFLILTTYDCNFSCIYCYEKNVLANTYMNLETANRAIEYIKTFTKNRRAESLSIGFYGGEPLLNMKINLFLLENVGKWALKNDINLETILITNGSLMSPNIIEKMKGYNLKNVQITIDGPREVHNMRRPFRDGRGSFDVIISNVLKCVDLVPITIRVNIDKGNFKYLPSLLNYLEDIGIKNKISLWIGIVRGLDHYCEVMQFNDREANVMRLLAWKYALKRGFRFRWHPTSVYPCTLMYDSAEIIDPVGDIYKCWGLVGQKKFSVGKIGKGYNSNFYKWMTRNPIDNPKCRECNVLPFCNGGCAYYAYLRTGDAFKTFYCDPVQGKDALEISLRLYIIDKYREKLKELGLQPEKLLNFGDEYG